MKRLLLFFSFLSVALIHGQVTISPATFGVNQSITITVDTNSSDTDCNGFSNPTKVYMHSGIGNDANPWGFNVVGNWGQDDGVGLMTNNGNGTWSITITPKTYYGLSDTQASAATKMGMVFRNENGTQEFKANGCSDFFFNVGAFQLTLTSPSENRIILDAGASLNINATASLAADFSLTANGLEVHTASATTNYSHSYVVNQNTDFVLSATNGGETVTREFSAVIRPIVTEEALPAGLKDGINLDPLDATKATLVFYAPMKDFVHVIGDFNDWQIDANYVMKKDPATDRFWIELNGLTPQFNHMYQYLAEYEIQVADPYSTLVLDENNDAFIDALTYPDLPSYPTGSTTQAVTVLRTGDPDYSWNITNFQKPEKTDLVVYELLIRDFDALHSFDAVRNRLDYLENLGINAIELMPVSEFDGNESWGYNPSFHMALDKYYGTANAFKQFIDECHSRGIAVILDVVYNHASGQNPYYRLWNDSNGGLGGQATADNPFFNQQATHSYSVFNDFNHQSAATQAYIERTATYWIEEFKIDGFRWDLTKGFTQNCTGSTQETCTNSYNQDRVDVLEHYADVQWAADPDFYVIFEHLGVGGSADEETAWINYRLAEDKGIMIWNKLNPQYNEATMGYHDSGKSNISGVSYLSRGWTSPSAVSYMESHDEERLMYKNLEFGNSNSEYSVKNLPTALSRIETAGAFFFTVPGPKMIWQFGELGYDYSIDFNGRVGNKPIRWDYFDVPERKAIYNTWIDLINLKRNEPIFKTSNFTIDAGAVSGLKTIHLTLDGAGETEVKYVTVIGNFGITTQPINPQFQETGVWYEFLNNNKKIVVTNTDALISLAPGEYRIYGNNPSALFPDTNPPDEDSDGVLDADDLCPGTPLGSTVDVTGCEIFTLPQSNYTIAVTSETCRTSDNGKIDITVSEALTYLVTITNPLGVSTSDSFSSSTYSLSNLSSGNYNLCFKVEGEDSYEQCFELVVTEPEDLSVLSKVNESAKSVQLDLQGGDLYMITVNDITIETIASQITIPLAKGVNHIKVSTGIECQGVYEERVFISEGISYYPNPVNERLYILLEGNDQLVSVQIYGLDGRLYSVSSNSIGDNRLVEIKLPGIAPGQYVVKLEGESVKQNFKIIKK